MISAVMILDADKKVIRSEYVVIEMEDVVEGSNDAHSGSPCWVA